MYKNYKSLLFCLLGMFLGYALYSLFGYLMDNKIKIEEKIEENSISVFREIPIEYSSGLPNKIRKELLALGYKETFYASNVYKKYILMDPETLIVRIKYYYNKNETVFSNHIHAILNVSMGIYKKDYYGELEHLSEVDTMDTLYVDRKKDLKGILEKILGD